MIYFVQIIVKAGDVNFFKNQVLMYLFNIAGRAWFV